MIFPRNKRITNKADFKRLFRDGQKFYRKAYILYVCDTKQSGSRLGMAVSRKYTHSAVHRNQIKRLVRESFRQQTLPKPLDILFVAKPDIKSWDKQQLTTSLAQLWKELETSLKS